MEGLREIRQGSRALLRAPGFTVVAILILGLGIGANTAIFSVVNTLLLQPLPYRGASSLVTLWVDNRNADRRRDLTSYPNYLDWKSYSRTVAPMTAFTGTRLAFTPEGEPEQVPGAKVSSGFFEVLGTKPLLGRTFVPEEEQRGHESVVVLGYGLWQRRFGGDPSVVGQAIDVRGERFRVVGVMEPGFDFPAGAQAWVPLAPTRMDAAERRFLWLEVVGRLRPGVHREQAQAEMDAIAYRLELLHPLTNRGFGITVVPLQEHAVGSLRPALLFLLGAVFCVLLIACANVANLQLSRGAVRSREVAVRSALGASSGQLLREHLVESLELAGLGGALGLLLALGGVRILVALSPPGMPRVTEIRIDATVLAFALGLSLLTGLLSGLPPALRAARVHPSHALNQAGAYGSSAGMRRSWSRHLLVAAEIGIALMLVIGAGLLIKSVWKLQSVKRGFEPAGVIAVQLNLPGAKYPLPSQMTAFYSDLVERVRVLPEVRSAAVASTVLEGDGSRSDLFTVEGRPSANPEEQIETTVDTVTPGFFRTLGIPILQGRDFSAEDTPYSQQVAIINETMAKRFFPGENPVGKRFKYGGPYSSDPWMLVVGIVGDTRRSGLDQPIRPATYRPHTQAPFPFLTLVLRTGSDSLALAKAVRRKVWSLDPAQPISRISTLSAMLGEQGAQRRFNTFLLGSMAALALVLAVAGTYGVVSYLVSQSTREVGIRMALGAESSAVVGLILRYGWRLALLGIGGGLLGAALLSRLLASQLFAVSSLDPFVFLGVAALLFCAATLASYLPARRAAAVDPAVALRAS